MIGSNDIPTSASVIVDEVVKDPIKDAVFKK
jgi:hypothetical protein